MNFILFLLHFNEKSKAFFLLLLLLALSVLTNNLNAQCSTNSSPKSGCGFNDAIDSFSFNGVTANNVGCTNGQTGYSDFGNLFAFSAKAGTSVNFSVNLGDSMYDQGLGIWIDFNRNNFFEAAEFVFNSSPSTSVSGSISIPSTAIPSLVKMRIMCQSYTTPAASDACKTGGFYGETEDYLLQILPTLPNNAAVWTIDSPSFFCAGSQAIYAVIANAGINQIDSVEVFWEFDGVLQNTVHHTQLLDTLFGSQPITDTLYLGNRNFTAGSKYSIKVWTSLPNAVTDPFKYDDTLQVVKQVGLSGSYTIDPGFPTAGTNYRSFTELANDLNGFGICAAVNVNVSPGTYNDNFYLKNVQGTSASNTIIIDGTDSTLVNLKHDASVHFSTICLENTSHVHIKNMGIHNSNTLRAATILLDKGSQYNSITNSILELDTSVSYTELDNVIIAGENTSHNSISTNLINGGDRGILIQALSNISGSSNKIFQNNLNFINAYGIQANNQDSLEIIGNSIAMSGSNSSGIEVIASNNTIVSENFIECRLLGIRMDNYQTFSIPKRKIEISNNMIISENEGIGIINMDSIDIYHNSVSVRSIWAAINIISYNTINGKYDIRNNIFSSLYGPAMRSEISTIYFDHLDHNIYYSQAAVLLSMDLTNYADLTSFQTASPTLNQSSLEGNPQFKSALEDLHIIGTLANSSGDNLLGIAIDIDGDLRTTSVDIGADEYNPPSCPPVFDLAAINPTLDSIELNWNATVGSIYQYKIVNLDSMVADLTDTTSFRSTKVGNLKASTHYSFSVRTICGRGDTSIWWGPVEFYTASGMTYFENFEDFPSGQLAKGWTTTTLIAPNWTSGQQSTYGSVVKDHSIGTNGKFAYLNSDYSPGQSQLVSPLIYIDENAKVGNLSFWYFMNGSDMGNLLIYVDSNGVSNLIDSIVGSQQSSPSDPWQQYSSYIKGYEGEYIRLRFEAVKSFGSYSEMAVDDVLIDSIKSLNAGLVDIFPKNSKDTCLLDSIEIILMLRNSGNQAIDFTQDSAEIQLEVSGANAQIFTLRLNDNSLNSSQVLQKNQIINIPMGKLDMSNQGMYDFEAFLSILNDLIPIDDTLRHSVDNRPSGGKLMLSDSICARDWINLEVQAVNGKLQWQKMHNGAFVDEPNASSSSYNVHIDTTEVFRVKVCGIYFSDTLKVNLMPATPTLTTDTVFVLCGDSGTAVLTALQTQATEHFWFGDSLGNTLLHIGDTLLMGKNTSLFSTYLVMDSVYVIAKNKLNNCESKMILLEVPFWCTLGNNEYENLKHNLQIYPNPGNGIATLTGIIEDANGQIQIYNSLGALLYQKAVKSIGKIQMDLDLRWLPKGIYIVRLEGDNTSISKSLIIE